MDYQLYFWNHDFSSADVDSKHSCNSRDTVCKETAVMTEPVFRLSPKNVFLGQADLVSFWHKLG